MRYEDWRQAEIEDKRPLAQRFEIMPVEGYFHPAMNPAGPLQQAWNTTAAGLGSDLPAGPVAPSEYRPRGMGPPERPPAQQMPPWEPEYPGVGPQRQRDTIEYLRQLYGR